MRRLVLFTLTLFIACAACAQDIVPYLLPTKDYFPDTLIQKYHIKRLNIWRYTEKGGKTDSILAYSHRYLYDADSLMIEHDRTTFGDIFNTGLTPPRTDPGMISKRFFTYRQGLVVKQSEETFGNNRPHSPVRVADNVRNYEYGYDSLGRFDYVVCYDPRDSSFLYSESLELANGRVTTIVRKNETLEEYTSRKLTYNKMGELVRYEALGPKGFKRGPYAYTLKVDNTVPSQEVDTYREDKLYKKYLFRDGRCIETITYDYLATEPDTVEQTEVFEYNADGTISGTRSYYKGRLTEDFRYRYVR